MHGPTTRGKVKAVGVVPVTSALVFGATLAVTVLLLKSSEGEAAPSLSLCGRPRAANEDAGFLLPFPWTKEEDEEEDNSEKWTSKAQLLR
jgi:hypothetical protein